MTYDLKKLAISQTATMPLRDAAGEKQFDADGKPLSITLYSPAAKQFQQTKHASEERSSARMMSKMQGKQDGKITWSDKLEERAVQLANCTVSFNGFGVDGLTGHELFKKVYCDIEIGHIADDVEKFINERSNFMPASTTN